jgi:hypothetical protein
MGELCSPIFLSANRMTPDPASEPDDDLAREVYAHFGLCMYVAQVFETGLINILTALDNAKSGQATAENFDRLYKKHEALTFGNLMNALSKHNFVPELLMKEARDLKNERDHLAHRFFRHHDLDFVTKAGCDVMIKLLVERRDHFAALDQKISKLLDQVYEKFLGDPTIFRDRVEKIEKELLAEAQAKARKQ